MILTRIWIIKTIEKPENAYDIISFNKKGLFLPLWDKENNATKIILSQYIFVFRNILYVYFSFFSSLILTYNIIV
jgi:hypothetical protein